MAFYKDMKGHDWKAILVGSLIEVSLLLIISFGTILAGIQIMSSFWFAYRVWACIISVFIGALIAGIMSKSIDDAWINGIVVGMIFVFIDAASRILLYLTDFYSINLAIDPTEIIFGLIKFVIIGAIGGFIGGSTKIKRFREKATQIKQKRPVGMIFLVIFYCFLTLLFLSKAVSPNYPTYAIHFTCIIMGIFLTIFCPICAYFLWHLKRWKWNAIYLPFMTLIFLGIFASPYDVDGMIGKLTAGPIIFTIIIWYLNREDIKSYFSS